MQYAEVFRIAGAVKGDVLEFMIKVLLLVEKLRAIPNYF